MGWEDAKARAERREDNQRRRRVEKALNRGGTFGSSSFKSKPNRDNPNINNHYFNCTVCIIDSCKKIFTID